MGKQYSVSILIDLLDRFTKPFEGISKKLQTMGKKWEDVGSKFNKALTVPITLAAGLSVAALKGSEEAEARMRSALAATGTAALVSMDRVSAYAKELQNLTRIEDDTSISALAALQGFAALNEKGLKSALSPLQDMSEALDKDLTTMGEIWGKTLAGNTNMLARYGIQVDMTASKETRLAQIIEQVNKRWKGTAEALAQTGTGGLVQLYNKLGDLGERFGVSILKVLDPLIKLANSLIDAFQSLDDSTINLITTLALLATAIGPLITIGGKLLSLLGSLSSPIGLVIGGFALLTAGIVGVNEAMAKHQKRFIDAADSAREESDRINSLVAEYESLKKKTELNTKEKARLIDVETRLKAILPQSTLQLDEQARVLGINTEALRNHLNELQRVEKVNLQEEIKRLQGEQAKLEGVIKNTDTAISRERSILTKGPQTS